MRTMKALALLLTASAASAELPEPTQETISRGIICNSHEQVQKTITNISLQTNEVAEGCGALKTTVQVLIEPIEWYEIPQAKVLIARLVFPNGWVQYGWVAAVPNEDYEPPDPAL